MQSRSALKSTLLVNWSQVYLSLTFTLWILHIIESESAAQFVQLWDNLIAIIILFLGV